MRVDVLVPSTGRPDMLAVTLTTVAAQTHRPFRVLVADDGPDPDSCEGHPRSPGCETLLAVMRVLALHGTPVEFQGRPPSRAIADQRRFLFERAEAPLALFLDEDLLCDPRVLHDIVTALRDRP